MLDQNKELLVARRVARIQAGIMAFVFAVICGLGLFIITAWLVLKGGEQVGPHLQLLSQFLIGYTVSWRGSFIGFLYGGFIGGIIGWTIGIIYNKMLYMRKRIDESDVNKHRIYIIVISVCAFIVLLFNVINKVHALNPTSLWFGDVWVATLAKQASFSQIVRLASGHPGGFIVIQKLFYHIIPDAEISQQFFPFLCSFLIVPLIIFIIFKLTDDLPVSIFSGFIVGISPLLDLGVFNKPFIIDCVIGLILCILFYGYMRRPTPRSLLILSIAAILVLFISYVSLFLSVILINISGLYTIVERKRLEIKFNLVLFIWISFNLIMIVLFFVFIKQYSRTDPFTDMQSFYLKFKDVSQFSTVYASRVLRFFGGGFPRDLQWMALFAIPGLIYLFRKNWAFGSAALGIYLSVFVALALQGNPIGGGTTDTFSYPITIILTILGIYYVTHKIKVGSSIRWAAAFVALVLFLYHSGNRPSTYVSNETSNYIDLMNKQVEDTDAIIIHPKAQYAMGYYGRWGVDLKPINDWKYAYEVYLNRQKSSTLPAQLDSRWYKDYPDLWIPEIEKYLAEDYERVWFIITHQKNDEEERANLIFKNAISNQGYRITRHQGNGFDELLLYERRK